MVEAEHQEVAPTTEESKDAQTAASNAENALLDSIAKKGQNSVSQEGVASKPVYKLRLVARAAACGFWKFLCV